MLIAVRCRLSREIETADHAVDPDGISERLKSREFFPEVDPLIDPPDDPVEE